MTPNPLEEIQRLVERAAWGDDVFELVERARAPLDVETASRPARPRDPDLERRLGELAANDTRLRCTASRRREVFMVENGVRVGSPSHLTAMLIDGDTRFEVAVTRSMLANLRSLYGRRRRREGLVAAAKPEQKPTQRPDAKRRGHLVTIFAGRHQAQPEGHR